MLIHIAGNGSCTFSVDSFSPRNFAGDEGIAGAGLLASMMTLAPLIASAQTADGDNAAGAESVELYCGLESMGARRVCVR
jgi:hypothetical protein